MKKTLYIFSILLVIGCQSNSSNNSDQKWGDSESSEPVIKPEVITFNDSEGEASIDKNFCFLFDISGSMDEQCAGKRKIDGAKEAIYKFLEKVPDDINLGLIFLGVENEYGVQEVVPMGKNNREQFREIISNASPTGGTPLTNAFKLGTQKLIAQYKAQLGYGEYRLIAITDGLASSPNDFENTLEYMQKYPFIAVYGIGLCIDTEHPLKRYSIKYTDAYDYNELGKALQETIAELEDFDAGDFDPEELQKLIDSN